jgi:hypothetical protein
MLRFLPISNEYYTPEHIPSAVPGVRNVVIKQPVGKLNFSYIQYPIS